MSEQARKRFDIEEQREKDLLQVVKNITPVIPLIREWGKTEKKLSITEKEEERLKEEIGALDMTIKLLKGDIRVALAREHDQRCEELRKIREQCEELRNACEDFESEVHSYERYTELYNWGKIFQLLNSDTFQNNEEVLALMFLIYNGGAYTMKMNNFFLSSSLLNKKFNDQKYRALTHGWDTMLEALKANEI